MHHVEMGSPNREQRNIHDHLSLLLRYTAVRCCMSPECWYTLPEHFYPGLKCHRARRVSVYKDRMGERKAPAPPPHPEGGGGDN
jgi:hypothetical protein